MVESDTIKKIMIFKLDIMDVDSIRQNESKLSGDTYLLANEIKKFNLDVDDVYYIKNYYSKSDTRMEIKKTHTIRNSLYALECENNGCRFINRIYWETENIIYQSIKDYSTIRSREYNYERSNSKFFNFYLEESHKGNIDEIA